MGRRSSCKILLHTGGQARLDLDRRPGRRRPRVHVDEEASISVGAQIAGDVSRENVPLLPSKSQRRTSSPLPSSITCRASSRCSWSVCSRSGYCRAGPGMGAQGQGVAASESRVRESLARPRSLPRCSWGCWPPFCWRWSSGSDVRRSGVLVHRALGPAGAMLVAAYLISAATWPRSSSRWQADACASDWSNGPEAGTILALAADFSSTSS